MWFAIALTVIASTGNNIGKALQVSRRVHVTCSWPLGQLWQLAVHQHKCASCIRLVARVCQKEATGSLPRFSLDLNILRQYCRSRQWLAGLGADLGGALFMVAAFALAPVSLVQPVSGVGLVSLAVFSHFWLKVRPVNMPPSPALIGVGQPLEIRLYVNFAVARCSVHTSCRIACACTAPYRDKLWRQVPIRCLPLSTRRIPARNPVPASGCHDRCTDTGSLTLPRLPGRSAWEGANGARSRWRAWARSASARRPRKPRWCALQCLCLRRCSRPRHPQGHARIMPARHC